MTTIRTNIHRWAAPPRNTCDASNAARRRKPLRCNPPEGSETQADSIPPPLTGPICSRTYQRWLPLFRRLLWSIESFPRRSRWPTFERLGFRIATNANRAQTLPFAGIALKQQRSPFDRTELDVGAERQIGRHGPRRCIVDAFRLRHLYGTEQAVLALRKWLTGRGSQPLDLLRIAASFPTAERPIRETLEILLVSELVSVPERRRII
jgi:hypothetical protein